MRGDGRPTSSADGDRAGTRPAKAGAASAELASDLRRGSPETFEALRRRVRKIIGFRGYRMPTEDRKDLEQEVMTQIWQAVNRRGFEAERGLWGFVEVVTARRCIDWLRSRRREVPLDENFVAAADGPLDSRGGLITGETYTARLCG